MPSQADKLRPHITRVRIDRASVTCARGRRETVRGRNERTRECKKLRATRAHTVYIFLFKYVRARNVGAISCYDTRARLNIKMMTTTTANYDSNATADGCGYVVKRDGERENVSFDKVLKRIDALCYGLRRTVNILEVCKKVIDGIHPGVHTSQLDVLAAETAATMITVHPDYDTLAARIAVSNLHRKTSDSFSDVVETLYAYHDRRHRRSPTDGNGKPSPAISEQFRAVVASNADRLNAAVRYARDFDYSYFGFKTLERSYLLKLNGEIVERPQHMLMRVAVGIHGDDVDAAIETYELMSQKWFTHATPTLFNAGTNHAQLASCFLFTMVDDSIVGIFETLKRCASVSKHAGGIGLAIHKIRASGSTIAGTNGTSSGIVPMLRVFNATAQYVDQGGNKRPGAYAIYIEPWHADVQDFIALRRNVGAGEDKRARDLFLALWVPDLFMQRVEADDRWTLMCPHECPGLAESCGEEFDRLYAAYERNGCGRRTIRARQLWTEIVTAQAETGTPYMLYKDACNAKSNQRHLGTIQCSNLCAEIIQYSSPTETAVCNLASLALNRFVVVVDDENDGQRRFDFERLASVTAVVVRNLNRVIDASYYPSDEARRSNSTHRPIGVGVQGLADTFFAMRYAFQSDEAAALNRQIFETIYYAALRTSCELARRDGPYESYVGSPLSEGRLQPDLWGVPTNDARHDWTSLRRDVAAYGARNSLLVALMPTASTAQILGNCESFEPCTSNMYARRVLSGDFQVVNRWLVKDLETLGLWTAETRNAIMANDGSVQALRDVPDELKRLYKTVWEIPQSVVVKLAADRAPFVDQSQSMNAHIAHPTMEKLTSLHFAAWRAGLKTGMYYLRSKAATNATKFTVDKSRAAAAVVESPSAQCTSCQA